MLPARRGHRRGDRRPVVRRALPRARLDLHHVVPDRRKPRALHLWSRRAAASRSMVLPAGPAQRFVSAFAALDPAARRAGDSGRRIETLLWCWIATIVGFFSLSAGKQDLYIFPIVAAVAALGGVAIVRGVRTPVGAAGLSGPSRRPRPSWRWPAAPCCSCSTAGRVYALEAALIIGMLGLAGGAAALLLAVRRRPFAGAVAVIRRSSPWISIAVIRVLPEFERYKPVPRIQRAADRRSSRATSSRTTRSRCRAWCITCSGT